MSKAWCLAALVALAPSAVGAHTLDEYLQAARLSLSRSHVGLDLDLTPGALVAAPIVAMMDGDGDGVISPTEAAAYGHQILAETVVELNGQRVAMALQRIEVPPVGEMRDGMGTIRMRAVGAHQAHVAGQARLSFRNDHSPAGSVYAANALLPEDRSLSVNHQDRDEYQRSLQVFYDVHPTLGAQIAWSAFAVVTCALLVFRRRLRGAGIRLGGDGTRQTV